MTQNSTDPIPEQLIAHSTDEEAIHLIEWWNALDEGVRIELRNTYEAEKPERDDFLSIEEYQRTVEGESEIEFEDQYEYLIAHDLSDPLLNKNFGWSGFGFRGGSASNIQGYKPPHWRLVDRYRYKTSNTI